MYDADAVDADGDTLSFELLTNPDGMTIEAGTGIIRWTPTAAQIGAQAVTVRVNDGAGGSATQQFFVCVDPDSANFAPIIITNPAIQGAAENDYSYDVNALDANGDILSYTLLSTIPGMTIDENTGFIFWPGASTSTGVYNVSVRVDDARGGSDTQEFVLTIAPNSAPDITSSPILTATLGTPYAYDVNATDGDGDPLTFALLRAPAGMTIDQNSGLINWTPSATHFERETVIVEARDDAGGVDTQEFEINVSGGLSLAANLAPRITSAPVIIASARSEYLYDVNAFDPNGDAIGFDLATAPAGMTIDPVTGIVAWTPSAEQVGLQTVVVSVTDSLAVSTLQSFQISVAASNGAPVITSTPGAQAVVGFPFSYIVEAQDANGDTLTFSLDTFPAGATIAPLAALPNCAIITWTPTGSGPAAFSVKVSDGQGGVTVQTFSVTAVASAPNNFPSFLTNPRESIPLGRTYTYLPRVEDEDNDLLTFSFDAAPPAGATIDAQTGLVVWTPTSTQVGDFAISIRVSDGRGGEVSQVVIVSVIYDDVNGAPTIVSVPTTAIAVTDAEFRYDPRASDPDNDPVQWSLVQAPDGMSIDPVSGKIRWTPLDDQLGPHEIIVQATDPFFASTTQTFSVVVTCINQPPAILSRPVTAAYVDARYVYGLRAVDPEGGTLTFALQTFPAGMTINPATGVIRWTPSAGQLGPADVVVRVTDASGMFADQSFTIGVTEDIPDRAPVFQSRAVFRATVDSPYQYQAVARDPEGGAVTYSLISNIAGMTIDEDSGLITWTPTAAQVGPTIVIVAARDAGGNQSQQRYALLVRVNQAPVITSAATDTVSAGAPYRYDVQYNDPDGDAVTFALSQAPAGMTIDNLGRIRWTTTQTDLGPQSVQIVVTDVHGATDVESFTLNVVSDNVAPTVVIELSENPLALGNSVVVTVTATDDVGVEGITLMFNGQPVTLSPQGTAVLTPGAAGLFSLDASATDAAGNSGSASLTLRVFDPADMDGPDITITSPTPGAVVTTLVDIIGTVTDPNLDFYRVEYARADLVSLNNPTADDPDWNLIRQSVTSTIAGTLATFDPTLLLNDNYVIRVYAQDLSGNISARTLALSLDGEFKPGVFSFSVTDLSIAFGGIPISISRTYDTRTAGTEGDFGFGWSLATQDADIRESIPVNPAEVEGLFFAAAPFRVGTKVYITNPSGVREGFTFDPTFSFSLFGGGVWIPRFTPDPGVTDTLEVDPIQLGRLADGTFFLQFIGVPYNPSVYRLTTKAGLTYQYNQFEGLEQISDRSGNVVTFQENGVFANSGESILFTRDSLGRITQLTGPNGVTVQYSYDSAGNLTSVTDPTGLATTYSYLSTPAHYLSGAFDSEGNQILEAEYDAAGRLIGVRDANGSRVQTTYDVANGIETITDALGNTTVRQFDDRGNVLSITDPNLNTRDLTYDADGNLLTATDPLGNTITRTFDANGNLTSVTDPEGNTSTATYRDDGQILTATDPLGRTATFLYDAQGNLIQMVNALGQITSYTRDSLGRVISQTDSAGRVTTFEYGDTTGRPTKTTYPDGSFVIQEHDAQGRIIRNVNQLGKEALYAFDDAGRPLAKVNDAGDSVEYRYANGRISESEDAAGNITRFEYDLAGRKIREILPDGGIIAFTYNANNQVATKTDPEGAVTSYTYRPDSRIETVTDALGNVTTYGYDATGNVTSITDARLNITRYEYDSIGRIIKIIDPLGGETTYEFDAGGNYVATTDPNGNTTRFTYDALNRLKTETDALGNVGTFIYNAAGNVSTAVDPNGAVFLYEYNSRNQVTRSVAPNGGETLYTYDSFGNLLTATDPVGGVTEYGYDNLNRRTSIKDPLGRIYTYEYDEVGNTTAITDPLGRRTEFEYNTDNNVVAVTDPAGGVTRTEYDEAGRRTALIDPLENRTEWEYDLMGNLIARTDPLGNTSTFDYDSVYNLVEIVDRNGRTRQFEYDAANRMTEEIWFDGGVNVHHITYAYDDAGALTSAGDADSENSFVYDALYRVASTRAILNGGAIDVTLSSLYDAVGNRTLVSDNLGVGVNSTYDGEHNLTSRTWLGGGISTARVDFSYNLRGERTDLTRSRNAAGTNIVGSTDYTYDLAGQLTSLTHRNAVDAILADYDYTLDLAGQLASETQNGAATAYGYDQNGQLTSADRTATPDEAYAYDANGN